MNAATEGGLAAYRGYNGIQKLVNGDTLGAAGDAGEVVLRLLGVSLSAAELKSLKAGRASTGHVADLAADQIPPLSKGRYELPVVNETCFVAGTPILTPTGSKPIEQLQVGDWILSRPENDAESDIRPNRVERRFVLTGRVMKLSLQGQLITTTAEHPFYVAGKGWVPAGELEIGDALLGHDGRVTGIDQIIRSDRVETVYNLRVEQDHTYFVGDESWGFSIWVHNTYLKRQAADGTWEVYNSATGDIVGKGFASGPSAGEFLKTLSTFDLPTTWRSAKGVKGTFSDGEHTFRIDTEGLSAGERFHVHVYDRRGKEIVVVSGLRNDTTNWRIEHRKNPLKSPTDVPQWLRTDIRRLIRHAFKEL